MMPYDFRPFFVKIIMAGTWPAIGSISIAILPIRFTKIFVGLLNVTNCTIFHNVLNVRFVPLYFIPATFSIYGWLYNASNRGLWAP
jgi:hypothetical protein